MYKITIDVSYKGWRPVDSFYIEAPLMDFDVMEPSI